MLFLCLALWPHRPRQPGSASLSPSGTLPHSLTPHKAPSFANPCLQVMTVIQKGVIVVALKSRLSQDMQNEHGSPCLKIWTWWREGGRGTERQETGIHPCTCIALAQLHLKPDFYQNQEKLKISAATHNCANLIQGISGMPTNTVTLSPAALQMCLGRVQET